MLAMEVLNNFNNDMNFSCDAHLNDVKRMASRAIVNMYYNDKRLESTAKVRKQKVNEFKSRQRTKRAKNEEKCLTSSAK